MSLVGACAGADDSATSTAATTSTSTTSGAEATTTGSEATTTTTTAPGETTTTPTSTTGTTTDLTTGGDDGTLCATQSEGLFFPPTSWFYRKAAELPVAADSAAITAWMESFSPPNGFGTGTMRIDFSLAMMDAPADAVKRSYQTVDGYYYIPDCDHAPIPLPIGGYVEDYPHAPYDPDAPFGGYHCSGFRGGSDCHILVLSRSEQRLYELYHATLDGNDQLYGGCLALWDTTKDYGDEGRGQQCTSADAAGFPIAPLLFTADEIKAGQINHAIRFILPNTMIRAKQYVAPATHGTNTNGPATAIPYGGHMRLRADFPLDTLNPAARVVARALQEYGMYMSDGGNIALTAASDATGCATWEEVGLGPHDLNALKATDFEVLDHGPTIDVTYDCQRQQLFE